MSEVKNFFEKKREWSKLKDDILSAYLVPYLAKMSFFGKPIIIADCFAGKGRFDDGESGSPLIICNSISQRLEKTETEIKAVFIEKKYFKDLERNIPDSPWISLLQGDYEERMKFFIKSYSGRNQNLLLYVDPYGIKSILFSHFAQISEKYFNSIELLLNLNAFGFLREGCRLLGKEIHSEDEIPIEYEANVNSPDRLDEIAGGDYWRKIIVDYYSNKISMNQAEEDFVLAYCKKLKSVFRYVVNIPIKVKLQHIPKYRIIFGTNHEDGLLLMNDNMNKRWSQFRDDSRSQDYLFELDFPDPSKSSLCWNIKDEIHSMIDGEINLKILLVSLIEKYGIAFSTSQYKGFLKQMNSIKVRRNPELTKTGKICQGWDHTGRTYDIFISRRN